jgi:hypothetical protein
MNTLDSIAALIAIHFDMDPPRRRCGAAPFWTLPWTAAGYFLFVFIVAATRRARPPLANYGKINDDMTSPDCVNAQAPWGPQRGAATTKAVIKR